MAGEFCTITRIKTFIVCCNVALLLVGTSVLILGLKMNWALASLLLNAPSIAQTFKAVISTGFFISTAGLTGIFGAGYEILWLILVHFFFLTVIVIMEFSLGVTLMFIRTTIENYIETPECNNSCAATLDAVVLDYVVPSSGLMMSIIIVEGLMIYGTMRLYFHIRDTRKSAELASRQTHNLQLQNVPATQPEFPPSPRLSYPHTPSYMNRAQSRISPYPSPQYHSPQLIAKSAPQYYPSVDQQLPSYYEAVPSEGRYPALGSEPERCMTPVLNAT